MTTGQLTGEHWDYCGDKTMGSVSGVVTAIGTFFDEVMVELRKSSWPTRPELVESTAVIIVTVIALGIFVATTDMVIEKMITFLVGASG